ncbi:MAG: NAD-dependent epimerase/dehydratase family protein [Rhodoferax sp.]|uniref:NAD-dependent epimerase/dehydratase family protein n=1 Tax=Rhodoferax sp. TaxID=50421 RepID=UPI003262E508
MRITIFGGGGFIGSTIADRLLNDGHILRIFERPRVEPYRTFLAHERVEWITGDFFSMHDVTDAIEGADIVFHLVSTTLPKSSNDDPVYDVQSNVISTLQMLNAMVAHKVSRIVFISSGGTVYGDPVYLPIDEKHPTDPHVSYGITKLAIEKYLLMYARLYGIKPVILRVANPFGERQRVETAQGAVGVFISQALRGKKIEIWGDGSVTRDFIYIGDVAEAFAKAATYLGTHHVFNISSGSGTSLNELVQTLEDVLDAPVNREYKAGRGFDVPVSILCNKLAQKELGWAPAVRMREGIARTAEWMRLDILK